MRIRAAVPRDLPGIKAIYAHEIESGYATFDEAMPGEESWRAKLESVEPGDHLLVAEDASRIRGYAYSTGYRPRRAYRHTRETSVYLAQDATGQGLGTALMTELLAQLRADPVHTVLAGIAQPNPASEALHASLGFQRVGTMAEVGWKFGRWIDVGWWQLRLPG